jgi:cytoskeletal protein CcmA (bactofilin family)
MLFAKKEDEFSYDYATRQPSSPVTPMQQASSMAQARAKSAPTRSVIDSWLMITGNLQSESEVQVDGKIEGDIRCAHLTVGKDATINGNITAEEVVVRGKVKGTIRANRVILQESAQVDSEIFHTKLAIEEGASFEGRSRMCADPLNAEIVNLHAA